MLEQIADSPSYLCHSAICSLMEVSMCIMSLRSLGSVAQISLVGIIDWQCSGPSRQRVKMQQMLVHRHSREQDQSGHFTLPICPFFSRADFNEWIHRYFASLLPAVAVWTGSIPVSYLLTSGLRHLSVSRYDEQCIGSSEPVLWACIYQLLGFWFLVQPSGFHGHPSNFKCPSLTGFLSSLKGDYNLVRVY